MAHIRGKLPFFVKDNTKFTGPNDIIEQRIEANRVEYERLLKDENYTNAKFNPSNGALMAIHKDHNFDNTIGKFGIPRGDYERISIDVLYNYGRSVVLQSEKQEGLRIPEGLLDGKKFEIKAVEGIGKRNIVDKISEAGRQDAESIVLYFHDPKMFDKQRLVRAYSGYSNLSKSKHVQTVYYIINKKLYKL